MKNDALITNQTNIVRDITNQTNIVQYSAGQSYSKIYFKTYLHQNKGFQTNILLQNKIYCYILQKLKKYFESNQSLYKNI